MTLTDSKRAFEVGCRRGSKVDPIVSDFKEPLEPSPWAQKRALLLKRVLKKRPLVSSVKAQEETHKKIGL